MEQNSKSQVQVVFVFTVVVVVAVVAVVANKWKWNELVNAYGGRDVAALKELFTGATQRLLSDDPRDPGRGPRCQFQINGPLKQLVTQRATVEIVNSKSLTKSFW